jgi:hypothetical protein
VTTLGTNKALTITAILPGFSMGVYLVGLECKKNYNETISELDE